MKLQGRMGRRGGGGEVKIRERSGTRREGCGGNVKSAQEDGKEKQIYFLPFAQILGARRSPPPLAITVKF